MKAVHVISGISREGGGPSRSSQALVAALNAAGCDTWLLSCTVGDVAWMEGVLHFAAPERGERRTHFFARVFAAEKPDVVHLHGIWSWPIHLAAKTARRMGIPYVIAPRGMLEPWSLKTKWLKKRIARFLYQDKDLKKAAALHATAESEAVQFRKLGFKNPIIVSPNGVSLPKEPMSKVEVEQMNGSGDRESVEKATDFTDRHGWVAEGGEPRRVLFVSRMHAKKGVLELVEAWARAKPQDWQCELVYTLNGDEERAYEARVKERIGALGMSAGTEQTGNADFILTGPLTDDAKWAAYARADLFVLPTYSENFGIVVAEALWAGLPVITTKGTPWQELEERKCGWWIDLPPKESLVAALREATGLPRETLREMGERGHKLVEEKYLWPAIGRQMARGYEKICRGEKGMNIWTWRSGGRGEKVQTEVAVNMV